MRWLSVPLLALVLVLAANPTRATDEFDRAGYEKAIGALLCDCGCHPQSVADCACGRAAAMRREIAALIESGGPGGAPMTGDEVIARYVAEQGEDILVSPRATGFNLVAWLGPLIGLVAAMLLMALVVRRLAARHTAIPVPAAGAPVEGDEGYRERLRRAVEESR